VLEGSIEGIQPGRRGADGSLKLPEINSHVVGKRDLPIAGMQRLAERAAQGVERRAQLVLSIMAVFIRPEEGQQVVAAERCGLGGEVVEQRPAPAARDREHLPVAKHLRRPKEEH
jgi:hypothetical protein